MSGIRDEIAHEVEQLAEISNLPPVLEEMRLAGQTLLQMDDELLQREHTRYGNSEAIYFMAQYADSLMSKIRDEIAREVEKLAEISNLPPVLDEIRLAGQTLLQLEDGLLQREHVRFGSSEALHFMAQYATGFTPKELGISISRNGGE